MVEPALMELYPVVLEHAAALLRRTPWDVAHSADLLSQAHAQAQHGYGHRALVCGIDVYNVEVEAWGGSVHQPAGNGVPTLLGPSMGDVTEITALTPLHLHQSGRLPLLLAAALRLRALCPGVTVRVPLAGPYALASGLLGMENLLFAMLEQPTETQAALGFLAEHQARLIRELAVLYLPVTVYDSGAAPPLLTPELFRTFVAPALRQVLKVAPTHYVLGGDVAPIAGDIFSAGPQEVICPAETDQSRFMAVASQWPAVVVRVNIPVAAWLGDDMALHQALQQATQLARRHPRGIVGTGVLPYDVAPERVSRVLAWMAGQSQ
jgi:hypothetical protein